MTETISTLILGVIQGIGEFLPISSSGHLLVFGRLLFGDGFTGEESLALGILLHAGTLLALLVVLGNRFVRILFGSLRTAALVVVASIPTAILGLLIEKKWDVLLGSLTVTGVGFLGTALLLRLTFGPGRNRGSASASAREPILLEKLSIRNAVMVGLLQGVAVLPGFSRSGLTMAAGRFGGLSPTDAAIFSFLLSIPAVGGAVILEMVKLVRHPDLLGDFSVVQALAALIVSFGVGVVSLRFLLRLLDTGRLYRFAWWLVPLGFFVLIKTWLG